MISFLILFFKELNWKVKESQTMSKGWLTEYAQSIEEREAFWAKKSQIIDWISPWQTVSSGSFKEGNIQWFEEGELNACYNCVDRHLEKHAEKIAFYWEGDNPEHSK